MSKTIARIAVLLTIGLSVGAARAQDFSGYVWEFPQAGEVRLPAEKGRWAKGWRPMEFSGRKRSGSNLSGSGQCFGSRWMWYGTMMTCVSFGIVYPPACTQLSFSEGRQECDVIIKWKFLSSKGTFERQQGPKICFLKLYRESMATWDGGDSSCVLLSDSGS